MPRGNPQNLIRNDSLTPEELRKKAKMAGIASGKVRAEKKQMRKIASMIMDHPLNTEEKGLLKNLGIKGQHIDKTKKALAFAKCLQKCIEKGDARQLVTLLEISGEINHDVNFPSEPPNKRRVVQILMSGPNKTR